jgi:HEAT repeat protein
VVDDPHTVAMRARAAVLAGYLGDADAVEAATRDPAPSVRARAIGAAARLGRRTVADRVRDLDDDAVEVRRRACELESRAPRHSTRVESALLARLGDADPLVTAAAADALGELRSARAVDALSGVVHEHADARCREAAVAALGAIGRPEGLDAVLHALGDRPAVRRRATVALAAFHGPAVEDALARARDDRDWQVREVARALLDDGDRDAR